MLEASAGKLETAFWGLTRPAWKPPPISPIPTRNTQMGICKTHQGASFVAQLVKKLSAVQETWVRSLGWEDPLEKEMATHSSILAWKISWTEETGGLHSMGSQRVRHDWVTNTKLIEGFCDWADHMPLVTLSHRNHRWNYSITVAAQLLESPPARQETPVWLLGREVPLETG